MYFAKEKLMNKYTAFQGFRITEATIKLNQVQGKETFKISPRFECKITGGEQGFSAILSVKIDNTIVGEKTPFDLRVEIVGNFAIGEDLVGSKQEQLRYALNTLFPYLRSFVTNLTSSCGIPAFYLPYIDVDAMVANLRTENQIIN